jgi:hypothetical protein
MSIVVVGGALITGVFLLAAIIISVSAYTSTPVQHAGCQVYSP